MCLLVYPKTDAQMNILTSLFKEMSIDYELNTFEIPDELRDELEKRLEKLKNNPETGISFELIRQKFKTIQRNENKI